MLGNLPLDPVDAWMCNTKHCPSDTSLLYSQCLSQHGIWCIIRQFSDLSVCVLAVFWTLQTWIQAHFSLVPDKTAQAWLHSACSMPSLPGRILAPIGSAPISLNDMMRPEHPQSLRTSDALIMGNVTRQGCCCLPESWSHRSGSEDDALPYQTLSALKRQELQLVP